MVKKRETTFVATDKDGNTYTIGVYREMVVSIDLASNTRREVPAPLAELRTLDGKPVERIAKGSYQILANCRINVTSDDPKAP